MKKSTYRLIGLIGRMGPSTISKYRLAWKTARACAGLWLIFSGLHFQP